MREDKPLIHKHSRRAPVMLIGLGYSSAVLGGLQTPHQLAFMATKLS
jgi:hypothetical protein